MSPTPKFRPGQPIQQIDARSLWRSATFACTVANTNPWYKPSLIYKGELAIRVRVEYLLGSRLNHFEVWQPERDFEALINVKQWNRVNEWKA